MSPRSNVLRYATLHTAGDRRRNPLSVDGAAHLLNKPNAIMTTMGGSKAAHNRKCEPAIPDNPAPTTNPDHTLVSIRPMTYFVPISVGAFTKGLAFADLGADLAALAVFVPVLTLINVLLLRKQER